MRGTATTNRDRRQFQRPSNTISNNNNRTGVRYTIDYQDYDDTPDNMNIDPNSHSHIPGNDNDNHNHNENSNDNANANANAQYCEYLRLESPSPALSESDDHSNYNYSHNAHHIRTAQSQSRPHSQPQELDSELDAFALLSTTNANSNTNETHPRPASASSIASSFIERASSVFQETSSAVQEVIKHGTFFTAKPDTSSASCDADTDADTDIHDNLNANLSQDSYFFENYTSNEHAHAIPLRHIQSSPTQQHLLSGGATLAGLRAGQQLHQGQGQYSDFTMKRSISTPLTFLQSRRGSAFGRVQSNSSLYEQKPEAALPSAVHVPLTNRSSAFGPVPVGLQVNVNVNTAVALALAAQKCNLDIKSVVSEGDASTGDISSNSNKSLTAQKFKEIKERRRLRLKNNSRKNQDRDRGSNVSVAGSESESVNMTVNANVNAVESVAVMPFTAATLAIDTIAMEVAIDTTSIQANDLIPTDIKPQQIVCDGEEEEGEVENSLIGEIFGDQDRQIPSSPAPPSPSYQKFEDDHALNGVGEAVNMNMNMHMSPYSLSHHSSNPPLPLSRRRTANANTARNHGVTSKHVIKPQPRLVLPSTCRSPRSHESSSLSKSTAKSGLSGNYSSQTHYTFSAGSVTSSVAEADREVRDTNRRELRRFKMDDADGTMSVHSMQSLQSSDTTSTNPHAYLALTSNSVPLREGANMQIERFFARNGSHANGGSGSGSGSYFHPSIGSANGSISGNGNGTGNGSGSGRPPAMNPKSPANTISSHSVSVGHSTSSGEDVPPQLIIKKRFGSGKKVLPLAQSEGYSKLGLDTFGSTGLSSNSNSSKSSSSKSSKSQHKDRTRSYQKMRTSTPSPGPLSNSPQSQYSSASPIKAPMTPISPHQFQSNQSSIEKRADVTRPKFSRFPADGAGAGGQHNIPSNKFHLVSPSNSIGHGHDEGVALNRHGGRQQGAFHRASKSAVTPERISDEMSGFRRASMS
mmetsp:Transcript_15778/g.23520  ORF Transcript_15778/g.23520 Transcript_15778/m.23520 type:complete len:978 (-) Transcript_15778:149-3082(-)